MKQFFCLSSFLLRNFSLCSNFLTLYVCGCEDERVVIISEFKRMKNQRMYITDEKQHNVVGWNSILWFHFPHVRLSCFWMEVWYVHLVSWRIGTHLTTIWTQNFKRYLLKNAHLLFCNYNDVIMKQPHYWCCKCGKLRKFHKKYKHWSTLISISLENLIVIHISQTPKGFIYHPFPRSLFCCCFCSLSQNKTG